MICRSVEGARLNKPNDLAFGPDGNLVFTCPGDSRTEPTGYVCVRTPDNEIHTIAENLFFPNGLVFTPDGRELIVAETYRQRLWKGEWEPTAATWRDPSIWAAGLNADPGPDRMTFTTDGTLFMAVFGGRDSPPE